MTQGWDVFFSHSTRRDGNTRTDRLIEGVRLCLTNIGRRVFLDRKCAMTKPTLVQALRDPLDHSRIAALFINSLFWKSPWVKFEVAYIQRLHAAGRIRVLCLMIEPGEPIPAWVNAKDIVDIPRATPIIEAVRLICERLNRNLDSAG